MVEPGCYIVHRTALPASRLRLAGYTRRETLTHYPNFLRYQVLDVLGITIAVNECGNAVVLYRMGSPDSDEICFERYMHDVQHYQYTYTNCLNAVMELTGWRAGDFDETFYAVIGAATTEVGWNQVRIPAGPDFPAAPALFLEALFVYGICRTSEKLLAALLDERGIGIATSRLISNTQDLVFCEKPEHFLVNSDEINLMKTFYHAWHIDTDVISLQGRFGQIIEAFNLRFNQVQAQRGMNLNRIAASVAVLALLSVTSEITHVIPAVSARQLQIAFTTLAVVLLLTALVPGMVEKARAAVNALAQWQAAARVRRHSYAQRKKS